MIVLAGFTADGEESTQTMQSFTGARIPLTPPGS
jgi:hypothetical protein